MTLFAPETLRSPERDPPLAVESSVFLHSRLHKVPHILVPMDSGRRSPEAACGALLAAAGGDAEFAGQLAVIFVEEAARRLAALRAAADAHDVPRLEAAAHSLKGAAAALGYEELARRARALETEARAGSLEPGTTGRLVELVHESCAEAQRNARAFLGAEE